MNTRKKVHLGVVVISVIMFFVALATVFFWLARINGKAIPRTVPLEPSLYNAFAAPDIVLSFFLFVGAYGLLKLRKFGLVFSLVAMGMWLFDTLLILSITKLTQIALIGSSLFFILATIFYLWIKKEIFE